jgi:hypothetical protein
VNAPSVVNGAGGHLPPPPTRPLGPHGALGPAAPPPGSIAALAERFARTAAVVVDVDELVAAMEATGVSDRQAQQRYGAPSVFALGEAVLAHLRASRGHPQPQPEPPPAPVVRPALVRAALFLTPAVAAAAAQEPLGRVAWPLLAGTLVTGWAGGQALAYLAYGRVVGASAVSALRLLGAGFLALAGAWAAVVAALPPRLVGDPATAYAVGLTELGLFAGTAAALVGGTATAVLRWSVPVWLVAAAAVAGVVPPAVDPHALLASAVGVLVVRAYLPALRRQVGRPAAVGRAFAAPALGHLLVGAGQAGAFLLVWRLSPGDGGAPPPAAVPLLLAVPLIEVFIAWHAARAAAGLSTYDDVRAYHRHLRGLGTVTLAALVPPLAVGVALAGSAVRLPYGISAHPDARRMVLALSAGVLLGGVYALTLLLATRRRLGAAVLVGFAPLLFAAVVGTGSAWAVPPAGAGSLIQVMLPGTVAGLAATYVLGLVTAAHAVFHPGSYR